MFKKALSVAAIATVLTGCNVAIPTIPSAPKAIPLEDVDFQPINDRGVFKSNLAFEAFFVSDLDPTIGYREFLVDSPSMDIFPNGDYAFTEGEKVLKGTWKFANGFWCLEGAIDGCYKWEKASIGDFYKVTSEFGIGESKIYYMK